MLYLAFEHHAGLEFEFYLATKLHMTVGRMRKEMSQVEYQHWGIYYARKAQRAELERAKHGN